jgi:hypothetical protein
MMHVDHLSNGSTGLSADTSKLLDLVGDTIVKGTARFDPHSHLQEANARRLMPSFSSVFLDQCEPTDIRLSCIRVHSLAMRSSDCPIINELGKNAEVRLAHLFELLRLQSSGQEGLLYIAGGKFNIAYIRDLNNSLWAVATYWEDEWGCWELSASLVGDNTNSWIDGCRFLSLGS